MATGWFKIIERVTEMDIKKKKKKIVMCVMMTEILTIDGGQKNTLLRSANIKKYLTALLVALGVPP